jgi:DNA (cytosine-5)-methyltransferase 1
VRRSATKAVDTLRPSGREKRLDTSSIAQHQSQQALLPLLPSKPVDADGTAFYKTRTWKLALDKEWWMPSAGRRVARERRREAPVSSRLMGRTSPPRSVARRRFSVAGLFAGIGGIELGLHSAGHRTVLLCEREPAARAVLDAHFPDLPDHDDICTLKALPGHVDLLAAGFPCQDLSQAGETAGIDGKRSGLVGEVLRLLRKRPVPWVLLENVPFMLQLGRGRALEVILSSLERFGYRWAYRVVDSLAFGLPQRRERVFLVATLEGDPREVLFADDAGAAERVPPSPDLAFGFYWTEGTRGLGAAVDSVPTLKGGSTIGIPSPPGILMPGGGLVTPRIDDAERLQGFVAGWTEPAERTGRRSYRWKLVGNAVTVDVAAWLGDRLASPGSYDDSWDAPLSPRHPWPRAAWSIGRGRFVAEVSTWPVRRARPHLHEFLVDPRPLSAKATAGFWTRLQRSSLRRPTWFDAGVVKHLRRMEKAQTASQRRRSRTRTQRGEEVTQDNCRVGAAVASS